MSNEIQVVEMESSTVAMLNKSEIDQQIATAHKFPRSIEKFRKEVTALVTLSQSVAEECMYKLPRGKIQNPSTGKWEVKFVEGASVRFAEVVASMWGNSRVGARVISDQGDFVTAQGVFHDLERNVAITFEVQRRVTKKDGTRFDADMVGVTANAACSIALRNAILKGIPKALWSDMYEQAKDAAIGNQQTLSDRRTRALKTLQKYGVDGKTVFEFLEINGEADLTIDHLSTLHGLTTSIKDGDITADAAFSIQRNDEQKNKIELVEYQEDKFIKELPGWKSLIESGKKTAEQIITTAATKGKLSLEQIDTIKSFNVKVTESVTDVEFVSYAKVADMLHKAKNIDDLDAAADLVGEVKDETQRSELMAIYKDRITKLEK